MILKFFIVAFVMTCDIKLGNFKPVKAHALTWKRSVNDYSDTATIKLPAVAMLKRPGGDKYEKVPTGMQLSEGMPVEIYAGYDGENDLQFKGFIRRRNFTVPLELECEGYAWQLRKKEGYNKTYATVKLRQLLADVIEGTDIKLASNIPDVELKNVYFKNVRGTDVLEYLKDKCLLNVHFVFDVLYCGLQQASPGKNIKLRLNWNVIKDNDLKFEANKELASVTIKLENRKADGSKETVQDNTNDGSVKRLTIRHIFDAAALQQIATEQKAKLVNRGYQGKITAFLKPLVQPGDAAVIQDTKYPERTGSYFVEGVAGEFGPQGGRQKIHIGRNIG